MHPRQLYFFSLHPGRAEHLPPSFFRFHSGSFARETSVRYPHNSHFAAFHRPRARSDFSPDPRSSVLDHPKIHLVQLIILASCLCCLFVEHITRYRCIPSLVVRDSILAFSSLCAGHLDLNRNRVFRDHNLTRHRAPTIFDSSGIDLSLPSFLQTPLIS